MRLAIFERAAGGTAPRPQLGLLTPDGVIAVDFLSAPTAGAALKQVIADFDEQRPRLEELAGRAAPVPLDQVHLLPPLPSPAKILCTLTLPIQHTELEDQLHVFLKSPGSTIGDGGEVILPRLDGAEVFTHNACLAVVISKRCRSVAASSWREVVFGYTAMVDITARTAALTRWKDGLSALGSSCDTFGPLGPWIVARAEVDESDGFELQLRCGGELRQQARFDDLDKQIGAAIERASSVMTLQPGDVIAIDGTADGQGPLQDGDDLQVDLSQVGRVSTSVRDPWGRKWDRTIRIEPRTDAGAAATSAAPWISA
jgi:2-keto-4-pentenoate hydratase/2-oxohepta-3-ene-1,7-dioic acid hydratase in catechol pathway